METYREKMYTSIGKNGLNHKDTIAISQELDEEIVKEMLKDPVVKCNYLERIIEAREAKIKRLEEKIRKLRRIRRINDLAEIATMGVEIGLKAKESIGLVVNIASNDEV